MFSIDVNKLRGKMAEKDLTQEELASRIGVSSVTLRSYMNDPGRMPYVIVDKLADELCDTLSEARDIFFCSNLRKCKIRTA